MPAALVEYPFEVMVAFWGVISAPPILLGLSAPVSTTSLLPLPVREAWAIGMLLGAISVLVGLYRARYPTGVARGLALLGSVCIVYALSVFGWIGFTAGGASGLLLLGIGLLCYLRAWWLRVRAVILAEVAAGSR